MAYKENDFDGFTNGTALTNATSDDQGGATFTNTAAGSGGSFTIITTDSAHGDGCLEIAIPSGIAGQFDIQDTASANGWVDIYFKLLAYPTVTNIQFPIGFRSSSGALGRIEMSTSGGMRINGPAASTYTSGISLNTWYRLSLLVTGAGTASTSVTLNVYLGESATPLYTTSITGATTAAQMDRFRFVRFSTEATAVSARYDTIRQNIGDSTPPGPYLTNLPVVDSATQSEGTSALTQGLSVVDAATQTEGASVIVQSFQVADSSAFLETSTEAIVEDTADDHFFIEAPGSVARGSALSDSFVSGEGSTLLDRGSAVSDGATAGESAPVVLVSVPTTDTWVITESPALLEVTLATVDNAAQSENATAPILQSYNATDSATQADTTTASTLATSVTDSWTMADASTLNSGGAISATDAAVQSDPTPAIATTITNPVDSWTLTESVQILQSFNAADAMNQTESPTLLGADLPVVDSATQADASVLVINTGVVGVDQAALTESPSVISAAPSRTDSAALAEAATIEVILSMVSDNAFMDEDATFSAVISNANDLAELTESATSSQLFAFFSSDGATMSEIAVLVESGVDETEFARINMQFPDLNPTVNIYLEGLA